MKKTKPQFAMAAKDWKLAATDVTRDDEGCARFQVNSMIPDDDDRAIERASKAIEAAPQMLAALRDFISYGWCRQNNQHERKGLAEKFALLADEHCPILTALGMDPSQMSSVEFEAITHDEPMTAEELDADPCQDTLEHA